jgi:hypothetical protein
MMMIDLFCMLIETEDEVYRGLNMGSTSVLMTCRMSQALLECFSGCSSKVCLFWKLESILWASQTPISWMLEATQTDTNWYQLRENLNWGKELIFGGEKLSLLYSTDTAY